MIRISTRLCIICNGRYQKWINIKVSISGEMAIIPYIHKQILLKDKYRTPQLERPGLLMSFNDISTINEENI